MAGDVAAGGASYKNETEADLAIRYGACIDMCYTVERDIFILLSQNGVHLLHRP